MRALTLWQRLFLLFAALLLACFAAAAWLQINQSNSTAWKLRLPSRFSLLGGSLPAGKMNP
jgi:hypothetical protein